MCIYVYLIRGEKYKMKTELWYEREFGPEKELRLFFSKLLRECLGMKNGSGVVKGIEEYKAGRPFSNVFNRTKKGNYVFTPTICCDFLELTLRNESFDRAVKVIQEWGNGLDECNLDKLKQCPNIEKNETEMGIYCKCIAAIYDGKDFKDKCKDCPIKLIYEILPDIENEYRTNYVCKKKILERYDSSVQEESVSKIYNDIQEFEREFGNKEFNINEVCELFEKCIQCMEIEDVRDYKLAYIKWYTARLCTWPYFKLCLLQANRYDERVVYSLLQSASVICNSMQIIEDEFQLCYNIEMDKIISYLSLAYQNPFIVKYCEKSEEILINCSRLVKICPESQYQLELYTEMWNLASHTQQNLDNIYKKKVQYLLKEKNLDREGERYYTYSYMYNLCKCEKPKLILSAKAYRLRKENLYNDTIAMITELFLSKALDDSEFAESGNLTLDIIRIKGYDENKKNRVTEEYSVTPPSAYQRIYGDNMLISRASTYQRIHENARIIKSIDDYMERIKQEQANADEK